MSTNLLLLHAGNSELGAVKDLAAALSAQYITVTVEDLEKGDYDRILDAVARADTVVHWPTGPTN